MEKTTIKNLFINEDVMFRNLAETISQENEPSFENLIRSQAVETFLDFIAGITRGMELDLYEDISNAKQLCKTISGLSDEGKKLVSDKLVNICQEGKIEDITFEERDESSHLRKFSITFETDFCEIAKIVEKIESPQKDIGLPYIELITVDANGKTSFQSESVNDLIVKWKNEIDIPTNNDEIIKCSVAGIPMHFGTFGSLMSILTGIDF